MAATNDHTKNKEERKKRSLYHIDHFHLQWLHRELTRYPSFQLSREPIDATHDVSGPSLEALHRPLLGTGSLLTSSEYRESPTS